MGIISREWRGNAHTSTSLIVSHHAQSVTKVERQVQHVPMMLYVTLAEIPLEA